MIEHSVLISPNGRPISMDTPLAPWLERFPLPAPTGLTFDIPPASPDDAPQADRPGCLPLSGAKTPHAIDAVREFLPTLADQSRNLIFVKNEAYQILYANQAFLEMFPPEQRDSVIGTTTVENFSDAEAQVFLAEDRKAFECGLAELTEEVIDYTGKTRHFRSRKTRFVSADGQCFILCISNDISTWVAKEREAAEARLSLENFAAIAAHDLRSPLGAIISGLDLLGLDEANVLTPQAEQVMGMMRHTAEGLMAQIANLLSAFKGTQAGQMAMGAIDFGALIAEVKFSLGTRLQETGGRILCEAMPTVQAERHLLRQVFHNLIENSLKYRSDETPVVIIRHVDLDKHHLFTVDDNGVGVSEAAAETSFDLYQQPLVAIDGFGIGLTLCRKIIASHGGEIWIERNIQGGCRVCFTIVK